MLCHVQDADGNAGGKKWPDGVKVEAESDELSAEKVVSVIWFAAKLVSHGFKTGGLYCSGTFETGNKQ